MYGCTDAIMKDTETWLIRCHASVFHPLVLPMIFAEHERKRFLNEIDRISTELEYRMREPRHRYDENQREEQIVNEQKQNTDLDWNGHN